jgi:hypothetical protein
MMLLDLVCGHCAMLQIQEGLEGEPFEIPVPVQEVNQSGLYEVVCPFQHKCTNIIDNIDFEMLFEYGLNALADRYYRDAVSSFASALERYFEFFIKVALHTQQADFEVIDKAWKLIAGQSERQLGAYIMLYTQMFGEEPLLLNPNKEVPFRNGVIHKGNIPARGDAIKFGDKVLQVMESSLDKLKTKYPQATEDTFVQYAYSHQHTRLSAKAESKEALYSGEQISAHKVADPMTVQVNIITAISVRGGVIMKDEEGAGNVETQLVRVLNHREPRRLMLFKELPAEYRDHLSGAES